MRNFFCALLTLLLAACASAPIHLHQLQAIQIENERQAVQGKLVIVGPVSLPSMIDRPQWVIEKPSGEIVLLEQERWAGQLDRMLSQAIAMNVSRSWNVPSVYAYPQPGLAGGDLKILISVRQLRLRPGQDVSLEALWQATAPGNNNTSLPHGRFKQTLPWHDTNTAITPAAIDQLVAALSQQIAQEMAQLVITKN